MTTTLQVSSQFSLAPLYAKLVDLVPGGIVVQPALDPPDLTWLDGTGTGQVTRVFLENRPLADGGNEVLNFFDGSLLDVYGDPIEFVSIRGLYLRARTGAGLIAGGAGSNAWAGPFGGTGHTLEVPLGSYLPLQHPGGGWTVDNTHKLFKVLNAGGAVSTYDVVAWGTD